MGSFFNKWPSATIHSISSGKNLTRHLNIYHTNVHAYTFVARWDRQRYYITCSLVLFPELNRTVVAGGRNHSCDWRLCQSSNYALVSGNRNVFVLNHVPQLQRLHIHQGLEINISVSKILNNEIQKKTGMISIAQCTKWDNGYYICTRKNYGTLKLTRCTQFWLEYFNQAVFFLKIYFPQITGKNLSRSISCILKKYWYFSFVWTNTFILYELILFIYFSCFVNETNFGQNWVKLH